MQIVMEDPHRLTPHALHAAIYGQESVTDLVENIKEVGMQEPILVTHDYRIVSGHRRWQAALSLTLPLVAIQIHTSTDEVEITKVLILSNKDNREKTGEQKAREMKQLKALYKGHKPMKTEEKDEVSALRTLTKNEERLDSIVGKELGVGRTTVHRSDYAVTTIDNLTAEGKTQEAETVRVALNTSAKAGYEKARELTKPKTRSYVLKRGKETKLQQEVRKRLGKNMPTRKHVTTYDLMIKLFDKLTMSERHMFMDWANVRIRCRVSIPTPPPESLH